MLCTLEQSLSDVSVSVSVRGIRTTNCGRPTFNNASDVRVRVRVLLVTYFRQFCRAAAAAHNSVGNENFLWRVSLRPDVRYQSPTITARFRWAMLAHALVGLVGWGIFVGGGWRRWNFRPFTGEIGPRQYRGGVNALCKLPSADRKTAVAGALDHR